MADSSKSKYSKYKIGDTLRIVGVGNPQGMDPDVGGPWIRHYLPEGAEVVVLDNRREIGKWDYYVQSTNPVRRTNNPHGEPDFVAQYVMEYQLASLAPEPPKFASIAEAEAWMEAHRG